jgi:hypothetical protein
MSPYLGKQRPSYLMEKSESFDASLCPSRPPFCVPGAGLVGASGGTHAACARTPPA